MYIFLRAHVASILYTYYKLDTHILIYIYIYQNMCVQFIICIYIWHFFIYEMACLWRFIWFYDFFVFLAVLYACDLIYLENV
jgi:hypothetical protein